MWLPEWRNFGQDLSIRGYTQGEVGYMDGEATLGTSGDPNADPLVSGQFLYFSYGHNGWGTNEGAERLYGLGGHIALPGGENASERPWWEAPLSKVVMPAQMVLAGDSDADGLQDGWLTVQPEADHSHPGGRHGGGAQILFTDGHVVVRDREALMEPTEEARRIWNIDFTAHLAGG